LFLEEVALPSCGVNHTNTSAYPKSVDLYTLATAAAKEVVNCSVSNFDRLLNIVICRTH